MQTGRHRRTHNGKEQEKTPTRAALVCDGTQEGGQENYDQATQGVGHPEAKRTHRILNVSRPEILKEYREESGHNDHGEGRVRPVVECPSPYFSIDTRHCGLSPFSLRKGFLLGSKGHRTGWDCRKADALNVGRVLS